MLCRRPEAARSPDAAAQWPVRLPAAASPPLDRPPRRRAAGEETLLDGFVGARHPFRKQVGESSIDAFLLPFGARAVVVAAAVGVGQPPGQVGGSGAAVAASVIFQTEQGAAVLPGALLLDGVAAPGGDALAQGDVAPRADARPPLVGHLAASTNAT